MISSRKVFILDGKIAIMTKMYKDKDTDELLDMKELQGKRNKQDKQDVHDNQDMIYGIIIFQILI